MRRGGLIAGLFLLLLAMPAMAQSFGRSLTVELADKTVNITTGFTGATLQLFGVKDQPGDVAIVVQGPDRRMVVRYKSQVMGIWMNSESVNFRNIPVYYDLATSRAESYLAAPDVLRREGIGLDALNFEAVNADDPAEAQRFKEALIRNKQVQGHYLLEPKNIEFLSNNFFRANFNVPANVPAGEYTIKTFLFSNGEVVDRQETKLWIGQAGFSARLYRFAHNQSVVYGLLAVLLAIVAGGSAWYFLRKE